MNMTCKNCAHCHVCGFAKEIGSNKAVKMFDFKCPDFQNKADVVNVVRCKDCSCKGAAFCMLGDMPLDKIIAECFCSYGERKDDE